MAKKKKTKSKKLKKKTKLRLFFLILMWFIAIGVMCYPLAIRFIGQTNNNATMSGYNEQTAQLTAEQKETTLAQAKLYNEAIYNRQMGYTMAQEQTEILEKYNDILKVGTSDMIGEIAIPSIDTDLPIFHGTDDTALESGIGHMSISSFPIGGENTRAVLTGHSGLTSSKLFTRLDELEKGDKFYIKVLDEVHAYKVTRIEVINKEDVKTLEIDSGEDEVSLITCYPFGQNTHRLVVTGTRAKYSGKKVPAMQKGVPASWHETLTYVLPVFLIVLFIIAMYKRWRRYKKKKKRELKKQQEKLAIKENPKVEKSVISDSLKNSDAFNNPS